MRGFLNLNRYIMLYILILSSCHIVQAQYRSSIDSIFKVTNSIERTRIFAGIREEFQLTGEDLLHFDNQVKSRANQLGDTYFLKQISYWAGTFMKIGHLDISTQIARYEKLVLVFKKQNEPLFVGYCHHFLAQQYFRVKNYEKSFENYYLAYAVFEKIGFENTPVIGKFIHDFALSHYFFKNYSEVVRLMKLMKNYPPYNPNHHIQMYNNIGMAYVNLHEKDSALFYLNTTIGLAKKYHQPMWVSIANENIGNIYFKEKKYNDALQFYNDSYQILPKEESEAIQISCAQSLAKVYIELNQLSESKYYLSDMRVRLCRLQTDLHFGDDQHAQTLLKNYYEIKTNFHHHLKQYEEAFLYNDSLVRMKKWLDSVYHQTTATIPSYRINLNEKQQEIEKVVQQKKKSQLYFWLTFGMISVISGLVFYQLYRSFLHQKSLRLKLLDEKKESLRSEREIQQELNQANDEINLFVSKINEQTTIISKLEDELLKMQESQVDEQQLIQKHIEDLKRSKILTEDDWIDFQLTFDSAFPEFKGAIKKSEHNITAAEMRYLMLVKLQLTHKEMARTLGVSDAAIRVTWNRLRKKMGGSLDDNPEDILNKLLSLVD